MNEQTLVLRETKNGLIKLPAYPFSGRQLFSDLRRKLDEELQVKTTVRQLSKMAGASSSTIQYWLESCPHRHVIGFMSLLERLSPPQRHAFIEEHSRAFPTLAHPRFKDNPASRTYLYGLLRKRVGLTMISRGTSSSRRFVLAALANSYPPTDVKRCGSIGIDLHRPNDIVPVETLNYIDGAIGLDHIRNSVNKYWPGILTSRAPLVLFNRLWSALPDLRADILKLTLSRHVVLADHELPGRDDLREIAGDVHLLTLSQKEDSFGQIRVSFRLLKSKTRRKS